MAVFKLPAKSGEGMIEYLHSIESPHTRSRAAAAV